MNDGTDVEELTIAANKFYDEAQSAATGMLESAWKSGQALVEIKAKLKHGEWMPWVKANFHGSERTAQAYMLLASKTQTSADLAGYDSIDAALKAIRAEKAKDKPAKGKRGVGTYKKHDRHDEVIALRDQGMTIPEIAAATGMINADGNPQSVIGQILLREGSEREAVEEAEVLGCDWDSIPVSTQKKIEQYKRGLSKRSDKEVQAQIAVEKQKLAADVAAYKAELDAKYSAMMNAKNEDWQVYKQVIAANKAQGVISMSDYKVLVRCLHSDTRMSISAELLDKAARIINDPIVKIRLVKDSGDSND